MLKERINSKINNNTYLVNMPFPIKNLLIEVTNACNNKCIFCYNHCMKRKRKFIDEKLCKKVLNEAYKLGMREVGFYVTGEPLLDDRLDYFILYAKNIGYEYIYITTNGILANLDRVKKLYDSGLNSIKYSINAINSSDYIFIHNTDNFNKVIFNLESVYDWKIKNNIDLKIFVSYIATKKTCEIDKVKSFFKNKCDEVVIMSAVNQGGLMPSINKYLSCNTNEINNKFSLPCNYPFNSVIVTCEGYLTACCMDFENLLTYADLNKVSLKDAWNNFIITELRKKHINKDVSNTICENCIYNSTKKPVPMCDNLTEFDLESFSFCNHLEKKIDGDLKK